MDLDLIKQITRTQEALTKLSGDLLVTAHTAYALASASWVALVTSTPGAREIVEEALRDQLAAIDDENAMIKEAIQRALQTVGADTKQEPR